MLSPKNFYTGELPTTEAVAYDGDGFSVQIITNIVLVNTSGSARTATVLIDPTGTNTTKYALLSALPLAAGETVSVDIRQKFAGDIRCVASGAGVNGFISGVYELGGV